MKHTNKFIRKSWLNTILALALVVISLVVPAIPVTANVVGTPGNVSGSSTAAPAKATLWFAGPRDIIGYRFAVYSSDGVKQGHAITVLDASAYSTEGMYCYLYQKPDSSAWELPDKIALSTTEVADESSGKRTYSAELTYGKYTKNSDGSYTMQYYSGNTLTSYTGSAWLKTGQVYLSTNSVFSTGFQWGDTGKWYTPNMSKFTTDTVTFFNKDTGWLSEMDNVNIIKKLCGCTYSSLPQFIFVEPIIHGSVEGLNYALTVTEWAYFQCNAIRSWEESQFGRTNYNGWSQRLPYDGNIQDWYAWIARWMGCKFPVSLYVTRDELLAHVSDGKLTQTQFDWLDESCSPIPQSWVQGSGSDLSLVGTGGTADTNPSKTIVENLVGVGIYYDTLNPSFRSEVPVTIRTTKDGVAQVPFAGNKIRVYVLEPDGHSSTTDYTPTTSETKITVPSGSYVGVSAYSFEWSTEYDSIALIEATSENTVTIPYYTLTVQKPDNISKVAIKDNNGIEKRSSTTGNISAVYRSGQKASFSCATIEPFIGWTQVNGGSYLRNETSKDDAYTYMDTTTTVSPQAGSIKVNVNVFVDGYRIVPGMEDEWISSDTFVNTTESGAVTIVHDGDTKSFPLPQHQITIKGKTKPVNTTSATYEASAIGDSVVMYVDYGSEYGLSPCMDLCFNIANSISDINLYYSTLYAYGSSRCFESVNGSGLYLTGYSRGDQSFSRSPTVSISAELYDPNKEAPVYGKIMFRLDGENWFPTGTLKIGSSTLSRGGSYWYAYGLEGDILFDGKKIGNTHENPATNANYYFVNWNGDSQCIIVNPYNSSTDVTVYGRTRPYASGDYSADLTLDFYSLTLSGDSGVNTLSQNGIYVASNRAAYRPGETAQIECTVKSGYLFDYWNRSFGPIKSSYNTSERFEVEEPKMRAYANTVAKKDCTLNVNVYIDGVLQSASGSVPSHRIVLGGETLSEAHGSHSLSTYNGYIAVYAQNGVNDEWNHLFTYRPSGTTSHIDLYYNTLTLKKDDNYIQSVNGGGTYLTAWSYDGIGPNVMACSHLTGGVTAVTNGVRIPANSDGTTAYSFWAELGRSLYGSYAFSFEAFGLEEGETVKWTISDKYNDPDEFEIHNGQNIVVYGVSDEDTMELKSLNDVRDGDLVLKNFRWMPTSNAGEYEAYPVITYVPIQATSKTSEAFPYTELASQIKLKLDGASWNGQNVTVGGKTATFIRFVRISVDKKARP